MFIVLMSMADILLLLENVLGLSQKSSGNERLFHCPFCLHAKPKLSINIGKRLGYWKCWVCGKSGRKISSLLYNLGYSGKEIKEMLCDYDDISVDIIEESEKSVTFPSLPKDYKAFWWPIEKTYEYKNALTYLKRRNISLYDIYRYQIGFCDNGEYGSRIIIPSYEKDFKLNYFISRSYYDDVYLKYKLPPFSKNIIVFENLISWNFPIILVEGVFDAISLKRNSIPLLGKTLPNKLTKKLIETKPPVVYVMLDDDARRDALAIELYLKSLNINAKLVKPTQKDANEMGFEMSWKNIENAVSSSFVDIIENKLQLV